MRARFGRDREFFRTRAVQEAFYFASLVNFFRFLLDLCASVPLWLILSDFDSGFPVRVSASLRENK
jgi:hypothetical protein